MISSSLPLLEYIKKLPRCGRSMCETQPSITQISRSFGGFSETHSRHPPIIITTDSRASDSWTFSAPFTNHQSLTYVRGRVLLLLLLRSRVLTAASDRSNGP